MGDVIATILVIVFAVTYVVFTSAKARNDRRREERLSTAFARAQAVRTRGIGVR